MGATETLEKKKDALRKLASDFAQGTVDEKTYQETTSSLFAEIADLKSIAEHEESLKKQFEVTYADIVGFHVLVEGRPVGTISGITVLEGAPALLLAGTTCPKCRTLVEEDAKYCVECGAAL